jgi:hypothetical protein
MSTIINATTTNGVVIEPDNSGSLVLQTNSGTTALTIDTSQRAAFVAGTAAAPAITTTGDTNTGMFFPAADTIAFAEGGTESMRIDSSGNVLVGATSFPSLSWTSTNKLYVDQSTADFVCHIRNSSTTTANNYGLTISYAATPNNTGQAFIDIRDSTAQRFQVRSNGGLANFSANNVNLSDKREKKDIQLAGSYLDKICAIPVKTFLYNDQTDTDLNLGVIAQDVQAVAPELVSESNWGTEEEPKERLFIYQTDLQYALMKCIQEQQTIINDLKARIETLEAK